MSFIRSFSRSPLRCSFSPSFARSFAAKAAPTATDSPKGSSKDEPASSSLVEGETTLSSCPANTVLTGLNYLKGQPPVIALPDEEYPSWLWTLLNPKDLADDGPGGKAEKRRLRKENRQRIKDQNFMKTQ
ncbi:hypothetical protein SERLA73DRAFT_187060 [Serpula lacrymans var. lacrymans S7.3]|uniref:Large ribosomal subunit protein mL54 n=2 Tax=Serpula lacrymans var. lacrymans TaxID=341189 RepID=F8Q8E4_SERL3|nr:uncharacterized protein SERLADRAFT_476413 [Serpula lacrymans var. lacrymans S7.9]EGN95832.1 hypothetical protein SERLA73DRAFT_187060 [Serpula lacrymans var. lacrymans S7.3]EGO21353.1 hypothetical protein SERLADRAFT_476413 [Serpula lacrymans var. lacrymans S7.9]